MERDVYNYYSAVIKEVGNITGLNSVQCAKIVKKSFFKKMLLKNEAQTLCEPPYRWALEICYVKGVIE